MVSELIIREVKSGVWTFSRPFQRAPGVPFGGRSTAVKLNDGAVWLFASTKADEETLSKIREIGPVKYIVTPDFEHYLNLADFHKAFPDAKVIGVDGVEAKPALSGVKFAGIYGKDPAGTTYGFEDEVSACYFSGFKNKDVAFFHKASKTLIEADLLFNLPPLEQYSNSTTSPYGWWPFVSYIAPFTTAHRLLISSQTVNEAACKKDAVTVDSWDFDTIIPCHGDVVAKDAKAAWQSVWDKYLPK